MVNVFKYPVYKFSITRLEREYLNTCLDEGWISSRGRFLREFEDAICEHTGSAFASAVMNGTVALHLALEVWGFERGAEVLCPNFSYIATSNAIRYAGLKPVFIDVTADQWNLDPALLTQHITARTAAIMVTDIYGLPADYRRITAIAREHDLLVIEDAAESLGASYSGAAAGTLGDIGIFSFFGNKTITCGEGGMILSNQEDIYGHIEQLKNQGKSLKQRYFHDILGYNYRMTNMQAAIGCAQMRRLHSILARKQGIFHTYEKLLNGVLEFQHFPHNTVSNYWLVSGLVPDNSDRNTLMENLQKDGIETRPFFAPLDSMPFNEESQNTPVTHDISLRGISLPSYPELSTADIKYICLCIRRRLEQNI